MQPAPRAAQAAIEVPQTRAALRALRARREELREQLEEVTEWRGQLVQQQFNAQATNNRAIVNELQSRISELSSRGLRLEHAMLAADDAIAEALAKGLDASPEATAGLIQIPPIPEISIPPVQVNPYGAERVATLMLGEALVFALLGIVLWRTAFRRGARSASVGPSPQVAQLQQSVDAIAVEVERISENQRFVTKLLNESGSQAPAAAATDRDPVHAR